MVVLDKEISEDVLLPAYNNHIVEFHSDSLTGVIFGEVVFGGTTLRIYPDANEHFTINLKELFKHVINQDVWGDDINPSNNTAIKDDNQFIEGTINFTTFTDSQGDYTSRSITVIKTVQDYKEQNRPDSIITKITKSDVAEFSGYPFDVSFFNDTSGVVDITTDITQSLTLDRGVNRILINDGTSTQIHDEIIAKNDSGDLIWKVKQYNCSGIYIKWFNKSGGWNYYLFNQRHKETLKVSDKGDVFNDFENAPDTILPYFSKGKISSKEKILHATGVEQWEIDLISTIIDSPRVLLYTGTRGQQAKPNSWLSVKVKTKNLVTNDYSRLRFNTSIVIEIPQTQMTI